MAVVNANKTYDHPHYTVRRFESGGALAAGTLTPGAHLDAAQNYNLYKAQGYITAAGTAAGAIVDVVKVEGTTTTTVATTTVGTAAVKGTFIVDCTTSGAAPSTVAAGGYVYAQNRADATLASRISWEFSAAVGGNICAPA